MEADVNQGARPIAVKMRERFRQGLCGTTVVVAMLSFSVPAIADGVFTPFGGASFGSADTQKIPTWGMSLASMAGGVFGFEVDFSRTARSLEGSVFAGKGRITQVSGNLILGIPIKAVRPYFVGGIGWVRTELGGHESLESTEADGLGASIGAGIMGFFTEHVGARFDLRYLRSASVGDSFREFDLEHEGFWRASIGLSLRF